MGAETLLASTRALLRSANARAAAIGAGAIALPGFNEGAYYPYAWKWLTLAFGGIVALDLLLGSRARLDRPERVAIVALSALLLWMLLSASWGVRGTDAGTEALRALVYFTGLLAFLLTVEREAVRAFLAGVLAAIVSLVGYGLYDKVAHVRPPDPFQGTLLAQPVGYANALGILAGIGALIALGLALDESRPLGRALFAGACVLCGVGLLLTSSRGAVAATIAGGVVLVALRRPHRGRTGPLAVMAVTTAIAAVLMLLVASGRPLPPLGDRPAYWHVALEDAAQRPLLGSGAGSFDDVWVLQRPIPATVHDAHNLYLEVLAELGLVGLGLLAAFLAAPLLALASAPSQSAGNIAAAGFVAFLVHAGLDWDWEYPVVTLAGIACGAAVLVGCRPSASGSGRSRDVATT